MRKFLYNAFLSKKVWVQNFWIIAICSVLGLLSPLHWFFDLFNHFRLQAVAGAAVVLAVMLWYKSRKYVLLSLFVILLNVLLMGIRLHAFSQNESAVTAENSITILSANVLTSNNDTQSLVDLVLENKPDVFIAVEVDQKWADAFEQLRTEYPFSAVEARDHNFGLAVYARRKFTATSSHVGDYLLSLIKADFGAFTVVAVHPPPPTSKTATSENIFYINEAMKLSQNDTRPFIIAGDFNATPWSDGVKPLLAGGFAMSGSALEWTWPAPLFPLAIHIDHVFVKNARTADFKTLRAIGSDHFPVSARISF